MQIVTGSTFVQLPFLPMNGKAMAYCYAAIDLMYSEAYPRHEPGSFSARYEIVGGSYTPNEERLLALLYEVVRFNSNDPVIVHCGPRTFVFGISMDGGLTPDYPSGSVLMITE